MRHAISRLAGGLTLQRTTEEREVINRFRSTAITRNINRDKAAPCTLRSHGLKVRSPEAPEGCPTTVRTSPTKLAHTGRSLVLCESLFCAQPIPSTIFSRTLQQGFRRQLLLSLQILLLSMYLTGCFLCMLR